MRKISLSRLAFFLSSFLLSSSLCLGQHGRGVIFDDEAYSRSPRLAVGAKATVIDPVVSLKDYTPVPGDQGNCGSCTTWSAGYSCFSISRAIKKGLKDRAKITSATNSAMYIFVQLSPNCKQGASITDALQLLKNQGTCLHADFDGQIWDPNIQRFRDEASHYKIKSYAALFGLEADANSKIEQTKLSLQNSQPVMIAVHFYPSFYNITHTNPVWKPDLSREKEDGGHALCVIGYNDYSRRFEIMNSWGTNWGNDGFFYLGYDDYALLTKYGYQLEPEDEKAPEAPVTIYGDFSLQKAKWDDAQNKVISTEIRTAFDGREYVPSGGVVKKDDLFELIVKNVKKDGYIYVFSIDPNNKAEVLFPFSKSKFAADYKVGEKVNELPKMYAGQQLEIPGNNKAISTDVPGIDHICILYSLNPIPDIDVVVNRINQTAAPDLYAKLSAVLGRRLMPPGSINFQKGYMSVSGNSTTGDIVPIILTLNVQ